MTAVFGISFSPLSKRDLVDRLLDVPVPAGAGPRMLVTANLDHIVQLQRRADFREAYAGAWTATIDGAPVLLYSKMRGGPAPSRVTGADLFADLMPRLSPDRHRCFFVTSTDETAGRLRAYLQERGFAPSAIDQEVPPFGFEHDQAYSEWLAARVEVHRPTHLFLGVGAPKSEIWAHRHRDRLGDCYVLPIGAALDFFVGQQRRAPEWVQAAGCEWLWRFGHNPRRMFRRYFVDSWAFLDAIRRDLAGRPNDPSDPERASARPRSGTTNRVRAKRPLTRIGKEPARQDRG
jgi:N-acetylglucosaminyldiphosphoundecaprenol N-acetyl-beta-D-mannosaminyltransferase